MNPVTVKEVTVNHPELGHIVVRVEGVVNEKSGVADLKVYYNGYNDVTDSLPAETLSDCMVQLGYK